MRFTLLMSILVIGFVSLSVGCSTTSPVNNSNNTPIKTVVVDLGKVKMEFVHIPTGSSKSLYNNFHFFSSYNNRELDHVTITREFDISKYELTQEQWEAVMSNNPSHFKGSDLPVENVSWDDVQEFIKKLNIRNDGFILRLPTETEWQYVVRKGEEIEGETKPLRDFPAGLDAIAWYEANSNMTTHPVGTKHPNAVGIYDMYGNVRELVDEDLDTPQPGPPSNKNSPTKPKKPDAYSYRVALGGSYKDKPVDCRSTAQLSKSNESFSTIGFRLVRAAK